MAISPSPARPANRCARSARRFRRPRRARGPSGSSSRPSRGSRRPGSTRSAGRVSSASTRSSRVLAQSGRKPNRATAPVSSGDVELVGPVAGQGPPRWRSTTSSRRRMVAIAAVGCSRIVSALRYVTHGCRENETRITGLGSRFDELSRPIVQRPFRSARHPISVMASWDLNEQLRRPRGPRPKWRSPLSARVMCDQPDWERCSPCPTSSSCSGQSDLPRRLVRMGIKPSPCGRSLMRLSWPARGGHGPTTPRRHCRSTPAGQPAALSAAPSLERRGQRTVRGKRSPSLEAVEKRRGARRTNSPRR
jgi:hypothetical protein